MAPMRIGGLASGMDTDATVKQLMDAEKIKLIKYNQNKQIKLWTQDAYNSINKDMANFIVDTKKDLDVGITGSISGASWLKKASSSDEDIFKASTRAGAVPGNHKIKVKKLAENVNLASTKAVDESTRTEDITFKIRGTEITFKKDESYSDLAKKINNSVSGVRASYDSKSKRFFLSTSKTGEDNSLELDNESKIFTEKLNLNLAGFTDVNIASSSEDIENKKLKDLGITFPYSLKIEGKTIKLSENDNMESVAEKINEEMEKDPPLNVEARYENGRFHLVNKTGANINLQEDSQKLFENKLKIADINGKLHKSKAGENAIVDFDGAENIKYSSNQFTINGISVDLKSLPADTDKEYNINIETDVDAVYDKIKGFVDKYNELVDKLNKKISEEKYRDYKPLTAEEKESMGDKDTIKLWEDKAKSGLLRDDSSINRILNSTRTGLYESVYSDYTDDNDNNNDEKLIGFSHLTQIGITTGKYQENGKLQIDEDDLREAIGNDIDAVVDLLFSKSDITELDIRNAKTADEKNKLRVQKRAESGLITRLYDDIADGMKGIIDKSGTGGESDLYRKVKSNILVDFVTKGGSKSSIDKDLVKIEKQIISEKKRLARKENNYYKRFAALEAAMNKMNSQSAWLASQLGGS
ncbi:MAG: flagellar filament capping protein FliD [Tepidibacter sp.]|jgi:flagellar hook-associated protein 2|uniref:flagellar filament capping protein FliD n=1 Tax=Tepidibacter sp. TaxID=2529387 RepID=UPI0025D8A45C|nr:flagellar filament capping protein FliD [Tepidibacter sp.]MCT4508864.1 flagellar filament capping protein FliD [Tepidibacter sp.]